MVEKGNNNNYQMPQGKYESLLSAGTKEFAMHPYAEASTERITKESGISKGLLFHYFGSKSQFYLCCLRESMELLMSGEDTDMNAQDFYGVLFGTMSQKMSLCRAYPLQTRLVNIASKESAVEIAQQKNMILMEYGKTMQERSAMILTKAINNLAIKNPTDPFVEKGLELYTRSIVNMYLQMYQNTPEMFFENEAQIQEQMRHYIDLMLDGIRARR